MIIGSQKKGVVDMNNSVINNASMVSQQQQQQQSSSFNPPLMSKTTPSSNTTSSSPLPLPLTASKKKILTAITMSHLTASGEKLQRDLGTLEVNPQHQRLLKRDEDGGDLDYAEETMFGRVIPNNNTSNAFSTTRSSGGFGQQQSGDHMSSKSISSDKKRRSTVAQLPPSASIPHHNFYGATAHSPTFKTGAAMFAPSGSSGNWLSEVPALKQSTSIAVSSAASGASLTWLVSNSKPALGNVKPPKGAATLSPPQQQSSNDPDPEMMQGATSPSSASPVPQSNQQQTSNNPRALLKPSAAIKHIKRRKGQSVSLDFGPHFKNNATSGNNLAAGEEGDDVGVNANNTRSNSTRSKSLFDGNADDEDVSFGIENTRTSSPLSTTAKQEEGGVKKGLHQQAKKVSPLHPPQLIMSIRNQQHQLTRITAPTATPSTATSKRGLLARKWTGVDNNNNSKQHPASGGEDGTSPSNDQSSNTSQQQQPYHQGLLSLTGVSDRRRGDGGGGHLVPFLPAETLLESALGGVGGTGAVSGGPRRFIDPFLHDARLFLKSELQLVDASDGNAVLCVYREVFESLEWQFDRDGCGPLLRNIRIAYENRIAELEKIAQIALTGDPTLQREKERYLTCQEEALEAIERSVAHERSLRFRIVEAEQHGHQVELSVANELGTLREARMDLSERAILDNAAIRDLQETIQNYSKVNQDLRERLDKADYDAQQKQLIADEKMGGVLMELSTARNKLSEAVFHREAAEKRHIAEMTAVRDVSADPAQYTALKLHAKKLEDGIKTLKKKLRWAEMTSEQRQDNNNNNTLVAAGASSIFSGTVVSADGGDANMMSIGNSLNNTVINNTSTIIKSQEESSPFEANNSGTNDPVSDGGGGGVEEGGGGRDTIATSTTSDEANNGPFENISFVNEEEG